MRCPNCKNRLLQKSAGQTRVRMDGPITFLEDGTAKAKCYWCKSEVLFPLQLQENVDVEAERFILRK